MYAMVIRIRNAKFQEVSFNRTKIICFFSLKGPMPVSIETCLYVKVIDLFNETVWFNHRSGRSPLRLLNRQSS